MTYDGERADAQALDQLESILRHVADELAAWHARALKAEAELKAAQPRSGAAGVGRHDPEARNRVADLESENKALRQRVEAARLRVHELLGRLTFLEDQARETAGGRGNGGGRTGGAAGGAGGGAAQ